MSFMSPVDMVEEDAADLQFPKVDVEELTAPTASAKAASSNIVKARRGPATKFVTVRYDATQLNKVLEQHENDSMSQYYGPTTAHNVERCATCRNELYEPYIKCPDCEENTLLCVQCFAQGRETAVHRNTHSYVIMRDDIQVFPGADGWTAREERLLLRTLEKQGYGNWGAVARALRWRHSPDECRQHYHNFYFGGIFERLLGLTPLSNCYFPERMPYVAKMRSVDPPRTDETDSMQFKMMSGYRCARGDFDTPYDNSAEELLTTILPHSMQAMETTPEDVDVEDDVCDDSMHLAQEELQLALVRAYNHRLRERERRYRIMRDNGLIMPNRTLGWIAKYAEALGSESNCNRFLSFMQICKPIKFDMLVESLKYFSDVQKAIFRLYELRQNGVRTLQGGSLYFKLKKRRLREQRERLKNDAQRQMYDWRKLVPNANAPSANPFIISGPVTLNQRKKPVPMDIIGMPGYTKLSEQERTLCSVERLTPQSYMNYKNILIAESMKMGHLRLADARRLVKIDVNKTRQIYDFLIEHGHINKPT